MRECLCCSQYKKCYCYFIWVGYPRGAILISRNESIFYVVGETVKDFQSKEEFREYFPWLKDVNLDPSYTDYNLCESCVFELVIKEEIFFPCPPYYLDCCHSLYTGLDDKLDEDEIFQIYKQANFPYAATYYYVRTDNPLDETLYYINNLHFPFTPVFSKQTTMHICKDCLIDSGCQISEVNQFEDMENASAIWDSEDTIPLYYDEKEKEHNYSLKKSHYFIFHQHMKNLTKELPRFIATRNLQILRQKFALPKDLQNLILEKI